MSADRLADYLEHMLEAVQLASSYLAGMDRDIFLTDRRTQQAVIYNLIVLGEAANRIAQDHSDFLVRHPDLPWKSIRGMRNRLAHGYFEIDLSIVWATVKSELPALAKQLAVVLREER